MRKIVLWGAGGEVDYVYKKIIGQNCKVDGIIDSNPDKQGRVWKYGIKVFEPAYLLSNPYDYILVTPKKYEDICRKCAEMNIPENKVLVYWRDKECQCVFENRSVYIASLEKENARYKDRWENAPYEYGPPPVKIKSGVELLKHILATKSALSRFGDGEFELMLERPRPWFQEVDKCLAERLRQIITEDENENIIIAIADDFGGLEQYDEASADIIRNYMTGNTRKSIMQFIDTKREYYDAYVSRPYVMYKDKKNAAIIFDLFKAIWKNRNVILAEGKYARIGVGNDLLSGAKSVKRILCPQRNSWSKYGEILNRVKTIAQEDDLICISLGPTATVMAYDLGKDGLQALDIGQLDNEYEWYLRGAAKRIDIPGKMVTEVNENGISHISDEFVNEEYWSEIVAEIS